MTNVERFNQLVALHNGCMDHQYAAAFYIFASDSQLFSISKQAVASCLYTQIPESRINTELFNYHQKTE